MASQKLSPRLTARSRGQSSSNLTVKKVNEKRIYLQLQEVKRGQEMKIAKDRKVIPDPIDDREKEKLNKITIRK